MATTAQPRTSAAPPCDVMVRASCAFLVITTLRQSPIGPGPSCLTLWGAPAAGRDVACRTHGLSRSIDGAGFRPRGGAERCRSHEGDLGDAEQALGGTHGIHASRLLTMPVADKRPSVIDCSLTDACGRSMAANGDGAGMRCIPIRQPHGRRPGAAPHTTTTRPHQLSRTGCREHSAARGAHGGWARANPGVVVVHAPRTRLAGGSSSHRQAVVQWHGMAWPVVACWHAGMSWATRVEACSVEDLRGATGDAPSPARLNLKPPARRGRGPSPCGRLAVLCWVGCASLELRARTYPVCAAAAPPLALRPCIIVATAIRGVDGETIPLGRPSLEPQTPARTESLAPSPLRQCVSMEPGRVNGQRTKRGETSNFAALAGCRRLRCDVPHGAVPIHASTGRRRSPPATGASLHPKVEWARGVAPVGVAGCKRSNLQQRSLTCLIGGGVGPLHSGSLSPRGLGGMSPHPPVRLPACGMAASLPLADPGMPWPTPQPPTLFVGTVGTPPPPRPASSSPFCRAPLVVVVVSRTRLQATDTLFPGHARCRPISTKKHPSTPPHPRLHTHHHPPLSISTQQIHTAEPPTSTMTFTKKIGRARQWAGEKMGADKTSQSDEFQMLEAEMASRQHGMESLQKSASIYVKWATRRCDALEDKGRSLPNTLLGRSMTVHANDFEPDSEYGNCLAHVGRANERIADLHSTYIEDFTASWLEHVERGVAMMKEYQAARKKLESRRLAYDASMAKMHKAKRDDFRVEEEMRVCKTKFDDSSEDVLRRMQDIKDTEADNIAALSSLVDAELSYHERAADELRRARQSLANLSPMAASPPRERESFVPRARSNTARSWQSANGRADDDAPPMPARLQTRLQVLPAPPPPPQPPRPSMARASTYGPRSVSGSNRAPPALARNPTDMAAYGRGEDVFTDDESVGSDGVSPGWGNRSASSTTSYDSLSRVHSGVAKKGPPPPPPVNRATKPPPPPVPARRANLGY
ncbi:BAR domain containing protein [Purpureocillium lilacinum]|uniref:BAR domain containing protein n=2 Tax=Purpureocillium lilacinum TaxID=33203 RepID=A0A2U3EC46_PURLI|nr:BAR domain containing protein [Purpureocillium lilacinum]